MTTLTAMDVGYNAVKALATNGRVAHFPSVVGTPTQETFSIAQTKQAKMTLSTLEGQTWPVGKTALRQSQYTTGRRDASWVLSDPWETLFCAALSELHKSTLSTKVVTGLPLEDWQAWASPLRENLIGEHTFKRNGGRWQTITVEEAFVITQPYGSLLDRAMSDTGAILNNNFATGTVAIADIGGNTLNLLVTDALEEIGRWTQGDDLGLLKALDSIARDIRSDHPDFQPKAHEVSGWLARGSFTYKGEERAIAPYARTHLEPLVQMILNRFSEAWPEPGRYSAVLLTGGGSLALGSALRARMNGVYPNVTVAPDAQFGNVRGYLKLARDLWE